MDAPNEAQRRRLAGILRRLLSDVPSDQEGAVRALRASSDLFHFAINEVENGGKLSDADMRKVYDAGFADGIKHADDVNHGNDDFRGIEPTWTNVAAYCLQRIEQLPAQHHEFIRSMASRCEYRDPTPKQGKYLRSLYFGLGGKPSGVPMQ
jgi:hypothetical protein